jgi:hypothetical protein
VLNIHPLVRISANHSLRWNIDSNDTLTDEQRDGLERIYANEAGAFDSLVREIAARRHSMPAEGQQALIAAGEPGRPRPIVFWMTHGGFAWLYAIAEMIAAGLGLHLPPLPPIPAPPPLP